MYLRDLRGDAVISDSDSRIMEEFRWWWRSRMRFVSAHVPIRASLDVLTRRAGLFRKSSPPVAKPALGNPGVGIGWPEWQTGRSATEASRRPDTLCTLCWRFSEHRAFSPPERRRTSSYEQPGYLWPSATPPPTTRTRLRARRRWP